MKTPEKVGAVAQYRYGDNRFLNKKRKYVRVFRKINHSNFPVLVLNALLN